MCQTRQSLICSVWTKEAWGRGKVCLGDCYGSCVHSGSEGEQQAPIWQPSGWSRTRASSMESERKGWGDVKDLWGTEPADLGYWIDAESKEKGRLCVTLMIRPWSDLEKILFRFWCSFLLFGEPDKLSSRLAQFAFFFSFIFISWRLITLQYYSGFLPYIDMNQPWIYMNSPSRSPPPPPSPADPF